MNKKIITFVSFLFLFLIGCNPSNKTKETLNEFVSEFDIPFVITSNIDLKTNYEYNNLDITASWVSSDPSVISNDGVIFKPYEDTIVNLTCHFSLNDTTIAKTFEVVVSGKTDEEFVQEIFNTVALPNETSTNISLPTNIKYNGVNYRVTWKTSDDTVITNKGFVMFSSIDQQATLTATISYNSVKYSRDYNIIIKKYDCSKLIDYLESLKFDDVVDNLSLPTSVMVDSKEATISWFSDNQEILDSNGKLGITLSDVIVNLTAHVFLDNIKITKNYSVLVKKSTSDLISSFVEEQIEIPAITSSNLFLPTNFGFDINGTWSSLNQTIMDNNGTIISYPEKPTKNTLTLNITLGGITMTKEYNTLLLNQPHFIMIDKFIGSLENLEVSKEGNLQLLAGATEGSFTSEEISCLDFFELVPTWCSTSSKNATCELLVSVKVDNEFIDYISYKQWGAGLNNALKDQYLSSVKLADDEIIILNNKTANAFKFKIILRRDLVSYESPKVTLITFALNIKNYIFDVDSTLLNSKVYYDVPTLYQHDVPSIGNIICSPTSSTMLLKYKGYDFSEFSSLEHKYIAELVFDRGNNIYGNWVYNCVGMSSFGERAYVKRFYSVNEFLLSIQELGPMAASIKGTVKYTNLTTDNEGSYTSGGHLLVVKGFEITSSETYIYVNDPNVKGVSIKMTLPDFLSVWRNVSYILE